MFFDFENIDNARDLSGLTRPDGARIREGMLLRTGHLGRASDGDIRRLSDMGLGLVVDMRDNRERERHPDRPVPGAKNIHIPPVPDLEVYIPIRSQDPLEVREVFHQFYRLLSLHPLAIDAYGAFFRELLAAEGKPVLWHCTQGKDRTGVGAALLMSALGFDRDAVIGEYLLTNQFAQKQMEALAGAPEAQIALMREVFYVYERNIRFYFDCVEMEYGSIGHYLELALSVGPDEIEKLEEYYLE